MHLLAYNLIRGVMAQAAEAHEKRPRQLSFKGTLQTITAFQEAMRRAAPADREFLLQAMLRAIAQQVVGDRPGRVEPRANKRRPKAQHYLMEPRRAAQTLTRCGITANLVPFLSDTHLPGLSGLFWIPWIRDEFVENLWVSGFPVVTDVSRPRLARAAGLEDNPGFDLLSNRPGEGSRGIEVKGRAGIGDVELTENEWPKACNQRERY